MDASRSDSRDMQTPRPPASAAAPPSLPPAAARVCSAAAPQRAQPGAHRPRCHPYHPRAPPKMRLQRFLTYLLSVLFPPHRQTDSHQSSRERPSRLTDGFRVSPARSNGFVAMASSLAAVLTRHRSRILQCAHLKAHALALMSSEHSPTIDQQRKPRLRDTHSGASTTCARSFHLNSHSRIFPFGFCTTVHAGKDAKLTS